MPRWQRCSSRSQSDKQKKLLICVEAASSDIEEINRKSIEAMDSMKSNFGVADPLVEGLKQQRSQLQKAHPLQASEAEYDGNVLRSELKLAREIQGLHAPIRLMMEHKSVSKVGHLPCISQR